MSLLIDSETKILGDRYYLHDVVAQSNHSRIFLATDLVLNRRKCVVKQLHLGSCSVKMHSKIESAFLHEVEVSKEIAGKHAQLCQFYNHVIDSGSQYLVQEWIEGITLEEKLAQPTKLSVLETKYILVNILLVLKCIHSLGIVHNDIKPSNIILRLEDQLPVLIDFGVARKINYKYKQKTIVGTPGYMSLEQAMGKVVVTNDLYSLGLTAIYLLTGKAPQTIDFNSSEDNFWQQAKTAFDPQLVAVIDRAIAPNPKQRFDSAKEMLDILQFNPIKFTNTSIFHIFTAKLESLSLIIILAMLGMCLYFYDSKPKLESKPPVKITDLAINEPLNLPEFDNEPKSTILETTNNTLKNVIFVPGTSATTVENNLGEPVWRRPGFWANSIAWSYEDMVVEGIDLGYIFDSQTNRLRQSEIAVPPTTDISTLKTTLNLFLASNTLNPDIQQGLEKVYHRRQNTYNFTIENLQGIIQRNAEDRIYMAVWEVDFH